MELSREDRPAPAKEGCAGTIVGGDGEATSRDREHVSTASIQHLSPAQIRDPPPRCHEILSRAPQVPGLAVRDEQIRFTSLLIPLATSALSHAMKPARCHIPRSARELFAHRGLYCLSWVQSSRKPVCVPETPWHSLSSNYNPCARQASARKPLVQMLLYKPRQTCLPKSGWAGRASGGHVQSNPTLCPGQDAPCPRQVFV